MAMHNSEDVGNTVATMFDELVKLGIETIRCGIGIMQEQERMEVWTAKPGANGKVDLIIGRMDMSMHPLLQGAYNGWKNKEDFFSYQLKNDDLINYYTIINDQPDYPVKYEISSLPHEIFHNDFYFAEGTLYVFSLEQLSLEISKIFKRFAGVFGQTYRRYLDLQKAEAQAREATIEAALEKVRGKAMAMHNSNDLGATAVMVLRELKKLNINPLRFSVGLLEKESRKAKSFSFFSSPDKDSLAFVGSVILLGHPVLEKLYESWQAGEDYFVELYGDQFKSYYEAIAPGLSLPPVSQSLLERKQYGYYFSVSVGYLGTGGENPLQETEIKIIKRFASIIDLTFRRYIELQKSEANARDAIKRASLDRVRAETASMRTTADLERITPLIWSELTTLGVPFIRCGVFIMDEQQQQIHTFLSTPDGKAIAAFRLPYTTANLEDAVQHWREKKIYLNHWGEVDFSSLADTLVQQGSIATRDQYLSTVPKEGIYLHYLPFLQGMLYVGDVAPLSDEHLQLVQNLADAFSTAYARYEDFNKLESAKVQIEKTLVDLKQTQAQLVQSEKMASLGELTAGIAHEIQNPLNFVNNFSEVSTELIEELKVERLKVNSERDEKFESELLNDIFQNLEKINHHGKRAGDIVKGMLQHSRSSSGVKEPTDINALADEYLRLAYHGLRAKDKSFNAKFETDLDESIGNVNVIPQDIGRVVLNLITNAFYAVTEKKNASTGSAGQSYEPTVFVSTKKNSDTVLISVKDNGNGIPQKVLDKIFQPFFTTKPTGQGTGLGLSLSYDIVKAHGGELKVETKDGDGAEFIIQLPH